MEEPPPKEFLSRGDYQPKNLLMVSLSLDCGDLSAAREENVSFSFYLDELAASSFSFRNRSLALQFLVINRN